MTADKQATGEHSSAQATTPTRTFIDFLLDETGSMSSCASATMIGYDDFVQAQREAGGECYLTLAKFDSDSIRIPYTNLAITSVPPLTFNPGSMTNLYDVIGERLTDVLSWAVDGWPDGGKSLFVIMTDGGDNTSRKFTIETARDLIVTAQERGVVVVFLGPNDTALDVGTRLGIPVGNIKSFHTEKMRETMDDLSTATKAFRAGTTQDSTFFS